MGVCAARNFTYLIQFIFIGLLTAWNTEVFAIFTSELVENRI